MKFDKKHIVIALLFIYIISIAITTIGFANAVTIDVSFVIDTTQQTLSGSKYFYIMLDENTPLTPQYLKDNPDYEITVSSNGRDFQLRVMLDDTTASPKIFSLRNVTSSNVTFSYNLFSTVVEQGATQYAETYDYWNSPIYLNSGYPDVIYTTNSNYEYIPPVVEEPEEDGEDTGILLDNLLDGIKSFFTTLFKPITDFIDEWKEYQNSGGTIWDAFGQLYEYVKGYTFEPIAELFEYVLQNDALPIVIQIWNFPIVKELLIVVVAILVVSGFINLLKTL